MYNELIYLDNTSNGVVELKVALARPEDKGNLYKHSESCIQLGSCFACSFISSAMVSELHLVPECLETIDTAFGKYDLYVYLVDVIFYGNGTTTLHKIKFHQCDAMLRGVDAILGMNALKDIDFAISKDSKGHCYTSIKIE